MAEFTLTDDPFAAEIAMEPARTGNIVDDLRIELDAYYSEIHKFENYDLVTIFQRLAAISGRASEMRSVLTRNESRRGASFRTKEVEPFIDELDRQYRLWSRVQSVRDFEFKLSGGGM